MQTWIVIIAAAFLVHLVFSEASFQKAKTRDDETLFPPGVALRLMYGLGLPMCLYGATAIFSDPKYRQSWWLGSVFIGMAAFLIFTKPGVISIDSNGIRQVGWFGLRRSEMRWDDVESAVRLIDQDSVCISSKNGTVITHTQFHVDRSRFTWLLEKHVRVLDNSPRPL